MPLTHKLLLLVAVVAPAFAASPAPLTRAVRGQPVPTGNSLYPKLGPSAGTLVVSRLQRTVEQGKLEGVPDDIIVEGPPFFDPEIKKAPPAFFAHAQHKAYIWTHWQLASNQEDKNRLRGPATHFQNPLLKPDDLLRLLDQDGPDGRKILLPCDIVVNGIGGIATHVSLYVGRDPATGEPHIIHALGTPATQQSYAQVAGNVVRAFTDGKGLGKMGVVEEGLGNFFGRFERDTYFIVRDPRMTDAMRQKGIAHARTLLGRGYDYDMNQSNDALYCTEVATEMMKGAYEGTGMTPPAVGTTSVLKLDEFAMTPDNLIACPDLNIIAASETGWKWLDHVVRTHVVGPKQRADD